MVIYQINKNSLMYKKVPLKRKILMSTKFFSYSGEAKHVKNICLLRKSSLSFLVETALHAITGAGPCTDTCRHKDYFVTVENILWF